MRAKLRISKRAGGWIIIKPAYGFSPPAVIGPFPTHQDAISRLARYTTGGSSATAERTASPSTYRPNRTGWRPVIR